MTRALRAVGLPALTLAVVIGAWTVASHVFKVPNYILPRPEAVLLALHGGYVEGLFWPHFAFTLTSLALGSLVGCSAAFILAALFAESRTIERLLQPYVVALQSMPKVALAPLIIVWFGFGIESKIVMVALICFFPVFINTVVGLKAANPGLIDLMRAFSASRWEIFFRIKVPSAAGHVFAGLQIAVVLGLIGAVVAEFVSSTRGLGYLINAAAVNLDTHVMFAALFSLAALGVAGSHLVRLLHRKLVFWDAPRSETIVTE